MSPVFAGRTEQLAALEDALDHVVGGSAATVLVGGEAGVGKSRLVTEFAARCAAPAPRATHTLFGGCLELGVEGLPFAPFTAALRQVVRHLGTDGTSARLPRGPRELARLLPELGDPPTETEESQLRLFEHVRLLLQALADAQPLVLVVEDVHWADRSTRELLTFLVHNLEPARVLLVVTYRIDELHRAHPLRPLLAELDRIERVSRVDLDRLSRREVGEQISGIIDRAADTALVQDVYARSSGNPLFVESLVTGDGQLRPALSDSLRDLLLAAVRRLPEETQQVLRAAAGAGDRVDHTLLAEVSGIEGAALDERLRAAVDGRVLVPDDHGYAFRHALVREVLGDDLLPGERTRLHQRYAESLERSGQHTAGGTVELAHHWYAAHDLPRALAAAWSAAHVAKAALAYAEQLSMLERVLELWDRVPDAAERVGTDNLGVLELAVTAARASGEVDRGVAYADAALRELDDGCFPARAARLLVLRGRMLRSLGREQGMGDLRRAAELVPADPPTPERAAVLATLAHALLLEPSQEEARSLGEEALALARAAGDAVTEAETLCILAGANIDRGELDRALALLGDARVIARQVGEPALAIRADTCEADAYEGVGRHHEAVEAASRGLADAHTYGLARTSGALLACNLAEALGSLGRWDEGIEVAQAALELRPTPVHGAMLQTWLGLIAVARGDHAAAEEALRTVTAVYSTCYVSAQDRLPPVQLEAALLVARGRPAEAASVVEGSLTTFRTEIARSSRYAWPLLAVGAQASAGYAGARPDDAARTASVAADLAELRAVAAGLPAVGPVQRAQRATFLAATDDADGTGGAWRAAVAAWEDADEPYPLAEALHRAGAAAVASGDRVGAAEALSRCAAIAEQLGAAPLRRDVADLARRARLSLAGGQVPARDDDSLRGLTPREFEVLRLLAAGHTNRGVAEALFISAKTASVHVSNILTKLSVGSRGEAAAEARRTGILERHDAGKTGKRGSH